MKTLWIAGLLIASCTLAAADTGIKTVVKLLERRYAVRHHGLLGLWLAKPFLISSGVGGLKIAEFEDFRVPPADMYSLKEELQRALGPEWQSFVEEWSRRDGERSVIYSKGTGDTLRLLIVTSEDKEGLTVVQMNLSGNAMRKWIHEPVDSAKDRHHRATAESAP
jgi:hypothetical protein